MEHPSEETLKRFVSGTAPRDESRTVVAHLLKGCALCARKIRALMQPATVRRDGYEPALERFDRRLIEGLESSVGPGPIPPPAPDLPFGEGREMPVVRRQPQRGH